MNKLSLIALFLLISLIMPAQQNNMNYTLEWKELEKLENKSLPQSALKVAQRIFNQATKSNNTQQAIKSLIYISKYKEEIDSSDNEFIIKELNHLLSQTTGVCERAVLHSMLAELYSNYYQSDSWTFNRRTALGDVVPEDMKEWTSNIFLDKIVENMNLSIQQVEELKKCSTKDFSAIVIFGEDSKNVYPTMYDFLMNRALKIAASARTIGNEEFELTKTGASLSDLLLPGNAYAKVQLKKKIDKRYILFYYYQQYLQDLSSRGMISTMILTDIDRISYLANQSGKVDNNKSLEAYLALEATYRGNETCVEVIDKIISTISSISSDLASKQQMYDWAEKGLKMYPAYKRIDILKNHMSILLEPELNIKIEPLYYSSKQTQVVLTYKNTQSLKNTPVLKLYVETPKSKKLVKEYPLALTSKSPLEADTLMLDLGQLEYGKYSIEFNKIDNLINIDEAYNFVVSDLMLFSRNSGKDEYEIYVVDRLSGKPINNATVQLYKYEDSNSDDSDIDASDLITTLHTNSLGLAIYKRVKTGNDEYSYYVARFKVTKDSDAYCLPAAIYSGNYNYENASSDLRPVTNIFIDRGVYRPGQTLYFKSISLAANGKPLTKKLVTVELYNVKREKVAEKSLVTNEFGSVSGEFILPQGGLLGFYTITVDNGSAMFKVEEYKRPTFEITFDKLKETYAFGQEITLKGYAKNYSGINLQHATVKYSITREPFSFWRMNSKSQFAQGLIETKEDGSFEITFTPEAGDGRSYSFLRNKSIYRFNINVQVTDLNGEIQSNNYSLVVGDIGLVLSIDMPEQIEKNTSYNFEVQAKNLQDVIVEANGNYTLYKLDDNDSIQSEIKTGQFRTGDQAELKSILEQQPSGKYRLEFKVQDDKGNDITEQMNVVLFDINDKKPPIKTNSWIIEKNRVFSSNKDVEVVYGVSDKDVYVLYQVFNNKEVFDRQYIKLSEENRLFTLPYNSKYGEELYMSFTYVKDGNLSTRNVLLRLEKAEIDNALVVKTETFRDKLKPGQTEQWILTVRDKQGNPVKAEGLASMYDKSLDKIYPSQAWSFSRPYVYKEYLYPLRFNGFLDRSYTYFNSVLNLYAVNINYAEDLSFDQFNWFDYNMYSISHLKLYTTSTGEVIPVRLPRAAKPSQSEAAFLLKEEAQGALEKRQKNISDSYVEEDNTPQIRRNFNETAFFYPHLRTNEKGEITVSFTAPDSNAEWRFRFLAHDKDAKSGQQEQTVVTRKELMVTPNMPRFIRQGDNAGISTKISNLSDSILSGTVKLEFFDPYTDKVIDLNFSNQIQSFTLNKDQSSSASWNFNVPNGMELLGCRIVGDSKLFSDGEQHVIAVLPNRILVTESIPFDVVGKGTETFVMDKLYKNDSSSLENYKLTLEFASNPAWYAVQALPTMSNPTNENAVGWFASYYVNTLGASIIRQYPNVGRMIENWKKQGLDKENVISNLQKNEELKAVLLEETPWVLDAKNETEQMERLSLLFDLNNTNQLTAVATAKLKDLQTDKGGWSWYKGLYPSRSITQYVLYGYAQLQKLGQVEYGQDIKEMQIQALQFIDKQILQDYTNLKKYDKNWKTIIAISTSQLEYLYVRSFYRDIPISTEVREAERFYTGVVSQHWKQLDMYERSLLAVLAKRNGAKVLAQDIVKSIKEHAVVNKELGMYWPNNRSCVFLSMSAISTHTFLMDALQENGASVQEMNQLKLWLLKQKQTQLWETTHASIDAISALLKTGSDWFSESVPQAKISVGGEVVNVEKQNQGTSYFKATWDKTQLTKDMAKVEVEHTGTQPAYGALYWQYFEDADKIVHQGGALNVNKQLYKEVVTESGKNLLLVSDENQLRVGDKLVVRLTVRSDRDMEFVQLKDMRAACFEPIDNKSGIKWNNELICYQTIKDASTNYYFDHLPKGTYVFEYPVYVDRAGSYNIGLATIQCLYAPEFVAHTKGIKVEVKDK